MVAQDHGLRFFPEVSRHARLLFFVRRDALVVVIGDLGVHAHRVLADRQQAALHRRHRDAGAGVCVDHAVDLGTRGVHAAVDDEPGFVNAHADRVVLDLAFGVDPHQARGGDLVEHQPVGVDEEVLRSRHARREVRVDQIGPLVDRGELVGGGEVDPHLPLFLGDAVAY